MAEESENFKFVTCVAPPNIAVIKYWGKEDEKLILPCNDSISVTLSVDLLHAKTTVCASRQFKENRIWLNGKEEKFNQNQRLVNCINEVQNRAREEGDGNSDGIYDWKIHICSENNFPTAAGLASSAAGYACLVLALGKLYNISGDLTSIARQGSGSACRSLHGGFVRWHKEPLSDGSSASQIAQSTHWPDLRVLVLVVRTEKKETSSSEGMQLSVRTSDLFSTRTKISVPKRLQKMIDAIENRDFPQFAEITMQDSNQFHAICADSYPPIFYMNDLSRSIVNLVHAFNKACGATRLAYTFDAGANACLFTLKDDVPLVLSVLNHYFPKATTHIRGNPVSTVKIPEDLLRDMAFDIKIPGLIKTIIHSEVGTGPSILSLQNSLLNADGFPITLQNDK